MNEKSICSTPMRIPNPVLRGFNPDPSICRVEDDYYLATSSFEYAPGIPLYHSRDLLHWEHVAYALPSPEHLRFPAQRTSLGVWAPTLRHIRGRFYVVATIASTAPWPEGQRNYMVSASAITGPWSKPVVIADGGIDPDLFEDADGTVYYSHNLGCRTAPIDLATGQLLGPLTKLWAGSGDAYPEAPHLYRIDGWYYIMLAEGGTGAGHSVTVARAKSIHGPWEANPRNPVMTHRGNGLPIQCCGHADMVQTPDGLWYAVCLGVRDVHGVSPLGRETFLMPVTWEDGWPVFGQHGRLPDPVSLNELTPLRHALTDDFVSPDRPLFWNTRMGWGLDTVQRAGGRLLLTPNGNTLDQDSPMAWIGFRQPDFTAHLAITLHLDTLRPGQRAGLTAYLDPFHHYVLEVRRTETECRVLSRVRLGATEAVIAERTVAASAVDLILEAEAGADARLAQGEYRFSIRPEGQTRQSLGSADMRLLGVAIANSYTGAYLGVFAEGPPAPVAFSRFTGGAGAMGDGRAQTR